MAISKNITNIEPFGELSFFLKESEWFGYVKNISPTNKVELTLCVENVEQSLNGKIDTVRNFVNDIDSVMTELYEFVHENKLLNSNKTIEEIKQMYFLTAITLQNDNQTWWLVLEPSFNVESIYNHFLRFTIVNKKIVWSNLAQNITG